MRGKTKEEYLNWLDTATNRELLNSLTVSEPDTVQKSLRALSEYFEKTSKEELQKDFEKYFKTERVESGTNPNLDRDYRLKKIIRNYEKFGNIVVGVDFDFTLVDAVTNETYKDIVEILKRGQRKEIIYCIWTANDNDAYVKSKWLEAGLEFQYYNESPINLCSRKPHFNILLDDSAGLKEALELFVAFLDYLGYIDS